MYAGEVRQATETPIAIGPFVDATDGVTPETGLANDEGRLYINGAYFGKLALGEYDAEGMYAATLSAAQTAALGRLEAYFLLPEARPVERCWTVKPSDVFDWEIAGTEPMPIRGQARAKQPAGEAFRRELPKRDDGTYKVARPIRLTKGTLKPIRVAVDVSPVFGGQYVETVGTPAITSGSSITATAIGPSYDGDKREVMIELGGTAAAGEKPEIEVPFDMIGGDGDTLTIPIEVEQ